MTLLLRASLLATTIKLEGYNHLLSILSLIFGPLLTWDTFFSLGALHAGVTGVGGRVDAMLLLRDQLYETSSFPV